MTAAEGSLCKTAEAATLTKEGVGQTASPTHGNRPKTWRDNQWQSLAGPVHAQCEHNTRGIFTQLLLSTCIVLLLMITIQTVVATTGTQFALKCKSKTDSKCQ